jgi:hypothetical protein
LQTKKKRQEEVPAAYLGIDMSKFPARHVIEAMEEARPIPANLQRFADTSPVH